jgi:hypothetical protein
MGIGGKTAAKRHSNLPHRDRQVDACPSISLPKRY